MCNTLVSCCVSIYIGFPNVLRYDCGSSFSGKFLRNAWVQFCTISKDTPYESHNSLGAGGINHALLRRIYIKLKDESPNMDNHVSVLTAVHGLNNTANEDRLIYTLLAFGTTPKIRRENIEHLCPNQGKIFQAMENSRKKMKVIVAKQRLKLLLNL